MKHMCSAMTFVGMLVAAAVASAAIADPVKTDAGLVSGAVGTNTDGRVLQGIPFAAPAGGAPRWKAPQPAVSWDGVRKPEAFGPRCMQGGGGGGRAGAPPPPPTS